MKLTVDTKESPFEIINCSISDIYKQVEKIDGKNTSFLILENSKGDYLQCAGNSDAITVELRIYHDYKLKKFEHFRIGKEKDTNPFDTNWKQIMCKIGPIEVYHNEILNKQDVSNLYKDFFTTCQISENWSKRNISKTFK